MIYTRTRPKGTVMGLFRKMTSVSTLGAVDMRSDKERIARKTAKAARAAKKGNKIAAQANAQEAAFQQAQLAQQHQAYQQQLAHQQWMAQQAAAAQPKTTEQRLWEVDNLASQRLISEEEWRTRRQAIIDSI